jgi:5-oxopent-3-ene-1,2,5-tricarboxylate decarboxylase/2-hydroxyhepta-2,4-diene-1,7-dioate isomerase
MALPAGVSPSVVVAVHLNYPSRAAQRGRTPAEPSYFLKPPSSVTGGGPVVRPQGAELLAYEGEIAIIVGAEAVRDVDPEDGARAIGWYAPADDFGVHDFRWADRGSNVLAKGRDGYTPIGPSVAAADVDPATLVVRTRVNGEVVQEGRGDELLFGFGALVADLSRSMTLRRGDVILTGTPAGVGPMSAGQRVSVTVEGIGTLTNPVQARQTG